MDNPNWPNLIRALVDSGLTQPQLAEAAGCGQSTISDLLNGKTTDPRTSTGLALIRLRNKRIGPGLHTELIGTEGAPDVPVAQEAEASHAG